MDDLGLVISAMVPRTTFVVEQREGESMGAAIARAVQVARADWSDVAGDEEFERARRWLVEVLEARQRELIARAYERGLRPGERAGSEELTPRVLVREVLKVARPWR